MEEKFLNSARNCTVLLSTCVIGMFVQGTARLSGQLFLACMDRYNVGRKAASFPFTLSYIIKCLSGPIAGYLGHKYGSKAVTELGCFLCAVGIGGCFFAEDILTVSVLWGGVFGLGTGLGCLLIPHILHDFFDKHYDKAHGMYNAGSGIGAFLLPLPTEKLLSYYGTSGTFLILSAVMLNCFVASTVIGFLLKRKPDITETCQVYAVDIQTEKTEKTTTEQFANSSPLKQSKNVPLCDLKGSKTSCETEISLNNSECDAIIKMSTTELSKPVYMPSLDETIDQSNNTLLKVLYIFIDLPFVIILITQCIYMFLILTIFTIVVDYGRDIGVPTEQEVYVLMILAISDTFGRLVSGYITDGGCLSKGNFYAFCFVMLGFLLFVITVIRGFMFYMIAILAIGLVFGGISMISCGLVIAFIEKKDLVIALPSRYFLYPLLGIAKPFLIEYFREKQGSYKGLLYFMIGLCVFNTILTLLLPAAKRYRDKRQQDNRTNKKIRK